MKTILGTLFALGLLSTAASAQWCPPGYGYRTGAVYGTYRTTSDSTPVIVQKTPEAAPAPVEPTAPVGAPIEPAPVAPEAPPK
ncbi:MAG: hypothetical protein SFW09_02275 [Hyphomicrobiaceae bacterium]|nr:hypothetical protein [Hyphomicrobiaceae bacterium]